MRSVDVDERPVRVEPLLFGISDLDRHLPEAHERAGIRVPLDGASCRRTPSNLPILDPATFRVLDPHLLEERLLVDERIAHLRDD